MAQALAACEVTPGIHARARNGPRANSRGLTIRCDQAEAYSTKRPPSADRLVRALRASPRAALRGQEHDHHPGLPASKGLGYEGASHAGRRQRGRHSVEWSLDWHLWLDL